MPYLIRPPPTSVQTNSSLPTHILQTFEAKSSTLLNNLHAWGWSITHHQSSDETYLSALQAMERALKKRRRRTQMIYSVIVGEAAPPSLRAAFEAEAKAMGMGKLYGVEDKDGDEAISDDQEQQETCHTVETDMCKRPGHNADTLNTPPLPPLCCPPPTDPTDIWYTAERGHLRAIARDIDQRWRVLPLPLSPSAKSPVGVHGDHSNEEVGNKKQKKLDRVKSLAERLEKRVVSEQRETLLIPFSVRAVGLF
ncbi:hypothetical protein IAQ61_003587 [Plenodomus lingam]|uniref:Predicted protein n=1 Tax=Leptosphaeria maculans (strain JN3 / isolate v23.1.3 / race Av1-4-5-6-7-8) TaxID=985895 RepID=E4ZR34_LEPMJ|nr:predicted protein [Plenodomus lingam JN3]KAH9874398.1 hypothetical protein IAQ61_003587 [Plenodomus lingam]CBX93699.1 predicted protein [Plenodomus lingam JN3]